MSIKTVDAWHDIVTSRNARGLDALLADEVVFHSPLVHTPQRGKTITRLYLSAAIEVFGNDSFRYVREIVDGHNAALEFEVEIDGVFVNGVDLIAWDPAGRIVDFKVMLRPLKAIDLIRRNMAAKLQTMEGAQ